MTTNIDSITNTVPSYGQLAPSFLPSTAVLELTWNCDHACLFCSCPWHADAFPMEPELSIDAWKSVITTLCSMGVTSLAFTGGEPLLKKGWEELVAFAAECASEHLETRDGRLESWSAPPKLYLLSNGRNMSDSVLALCQRHGVHLSMSLPGLSTFKEHTGGDVDANHILRWFGRAHAEGVSTTAGITVTSRNIHELYETIAEALRAAADTILLNRFLPGGRGLRNRHLELTPTQIAVMLETAEEVLQTADRWGHVGTELPLCLVPNPSAFKRLKVGVACSAAKDFFVIAPDGHLRVCNHSPVRVGQVSRIAEVKDHPYWRRFALKDYLPQACGGCAENSVCDGGCREAAHIVGGSPDAPDPALRSISHETNQHKT